ncbi:sulfotransferase family protein [Formosa sediminum]|uniref:Sulfotransferase family protein n=1 Tax=Formosa sediminum TaxID=2594004 RepID=A0A516GRH2_9FLAO|nr:sulfotransferase family 2 domain-containing protein [Formosa sediminum]QDO93960.1 sulfotransferase family protein [Formosa sediminum]
METKFYKKIGNRIGLFFNSPLKKGELKNFVFIHIAKTGGTSVVSITGKAYRKHLTAKQVIKHIGQKKWDNAYTFAIVRNPWDKVVSQYKFRTKTNKSRMADHPIAFKDWVQKVFVEQDKFYYHVRPLLFAPQVEWLKNNQNKIDLNKIIRFENLNEEYREVANIIGIHPDLPHLNSTKPSDYRSYYDEETKKIVAEWFAEDIELFNYKF